mmetsp:Transcript_50981/g.142661  ORF Transcript_50981/g.142661 Transcript_50981/m.142661 type:complete len:267 (-) Transcript_50981:229-1029(-)
MGSTHARQQALANQKNGSSIPGLGVAGLSGHGLAPVASGVPTSDPAAAPTNVAEGGQDERIPVVFTWTQGGQNVSLASSFTGWREQIPMVRSGNEFAVVQEVPRGVHQYKFIVDDNWRSAPDQPRTQDSHGNMNNVLDISHYQPFQIGMLDEKEIPPKFGQHIPDPNDYNLDAPLIPTVLHKSSFSAAPPRPQLTGGQTLSIPCHSFCDHIYLQQKQDDNAPTKVAVTHRYGEKYSTIVYATSSSPGKDSKAGMNPLKKAVIRPSH